MRDQLALREQAFGAAGHDAWCRSRHPPPHGRCRRSLTQQASSASCATAAGARTWASARMRQHAPAAPRRGSGSQAVGLADCWWGCGAASAPPSSSTAQRMPSANGGAARDEAHVDLEAPRALRQGARRAGRHRHRRHRWPSVREHRVMPRACHEPGGENRRQISSILFVCMGNICRSPTAEGVLRHNLARGRAAEAVRVDSASTHGWHAGSPPTIVRRCMPRSRLTPAPCARARWSRPTSNAST